MSWPGWSEQGTPRRAGRLVVITGFDGVGDVDLAVEAVPEDASLKRRVLGAVEAAVGPRTLIATNTSSLVD